MTAKLSLTEIAKLIDHSLLSPLLTDEELIQGCRIARQYNTATVCIKPSAVLLAKSCLEGSGVTIGTVVAFPHGSTDTSIKIRETERAFANGAREIDMVINIGKALSEDWDYIAAEIQAVNDTVLYHGGLLKVIFETDYLQEKHIAKLCEICVAKEVAFVKTSTGYNYSRRPDGTYSYLGATEACIKLMYKICHPMVRVKAAGNIRTLDDLLKFHEWGAARIGTSATESILLEAKHRGQH